MYYHCPVFLDFIGHQLLQNTDTHIIDATLGEGGHSQMFLSLNKKVIAFERDPEILEKAQKRLVGYEDNFTFYNKNYACMRSVLKRLKVKVDLALFDLGVSMFHYKGANRGFSFHEGSPLDMRLNPDNTLSAAHLLNTASQDELAHIFYHYAEERASRSLAAYLVKQRQFQKFETAKQLANAITASKLVRTAKRSANKPLLHPATKIFQALRIAVNKELDHIQTGIMGVIDFLAPRGKIAVISYHSLEDKIVKNTFKQFVTSPVNVNKYRYQKKPSRYGLFSKKPLVPSPEEIRYNPSARSAKLRILIRQS